VVVPGATHCPWKLWEHLGGDTFLKGAHPGLQAKEGHPVGVLRRGKAPLRSGQQDIFTPALMRNKVFFSFFPQMQIASVLEIRKMGC
jgi:hypothetical protein